MRGAAIPRPQLQRDVAEPQRPVGLCDHQGRPTAAARRWTARSSCRSRWNPGCRASRASVLPEDRSGIAATFTVPADWVGQSVTLLNFGAVDLFGVVWVNGAVGGTQGRIGQLQLRRHRRAQAGDERPSSRSPIRPRPAASPAASRPRAARHLVHRRRAASGRRCGSSRCRSSTSPMSARCRISTGAVEVDVALSAWAPATPMRCADLRCRGARRSPRTIMRAPIAAPASRSPTRISGRPRIRISTISSSSW
jgi:hypothetical protein